MDSQSDASCEYNGQASQVWIVSITWFFEKNHGPWSNNIQDIVSGMCDQYAKHWIYQVERCATTGNLHVQGYWNLKTKDRPKALAAKVSEQGMEGVTISASSTAGKEALRLYCMKDDTRVDGPWSDRPIFRGEDIPKDADLWEWQKEMKQEMLQKPDTRKIHWIWDPTGGNGKSDLCKHIGWFLQKDCEVFSNMKANDVSSQVVEAGSRKIYIWDLERTKPSDVSSTDLYCSIESVKNGYVRAGKHKGGKLWMAKPHVYIFSNSLPAIKLLSLDRWIIRKLENKKLIFIDPNTLNTTN